MTHSSENEASEKGHSEMIEVARTVTVNPFPTVLKVDGGLILGTEGLSSTDNLQLASDGHVSHHQFSLVHKTGC